MPPARQGREDPSRTARTMWTRGHSRGLATEGERTSGLAGTLFSSAPCLVLEAAGVVGASRARALATIPSPSVSFGALPGTCKSAGQHSAPRAVTRSL